METSLNDHKKIADAPDSEEGTPEGRTQEAILERRVLRKLDLWVLPIVTVFYLASFLDRSNIGNARVAGLQTDLALSNYQYELLITFTYVPYILAELPANLLLKIVGPQLLLPMIVTVWGIITMCQGFVQSFGTFMTCRVLLGLFEGGLLPGIVLYITMFYQRAELQWRTGMIFTATSLAGAFGGLLAACLEDMGGDRGIKSWSWIFIIEGVVTSVIGIISFFLLPESPAAMTFLTTDELEVLLSRLSRDKPEEEALGHAEAFNWGQVHRALLDTPQLWILAIGLFANGMTLYGLAYFLPSITQGLGFSATKTQLLTVPPYAAAFFVTMTLSYLSDKYQRRGLVMISMGLLSMIGFVLFLANINFHISYLGLFFAVTGAYCSAPCVTAWVANNAAPHYKRASVLAFALILTNFGGIASTWIFPTTAAPEYRGGTIICIICACLTAVTAAANVLWISWATKRKQDRREALLAPYDGDEKRAWSQLGDNHPDFRWIY